MNQNPDLQGAPVADDVTRSLPHAVGPEKSLLSTMLKDPHEYLGIAIEEGLTPAHFYLPSHSTLYEFLLGLFAAGIEIELVDMVQRLIDRGLLDRIGGPASLTDLYTYAPSAGNFRQHLDHVKAKFIARSLIMISNDTIAEVYDSPDEIERTLEETEQRVLAIRDGMTVAKDITISQAAAAVVDAFQREINRDPTAKGLQTGHEEFDRMTGGLKPTEIIVIGARPSQGKSAIMLNWAERISVTDGIPGLIFSAEMSQEACVKRLIFTRAKFALAQMTRGHNPDKGELQRIQRATMEVAAAPLYIDDKSSPPISYMAAKARRLKRDKGIQYILIDYLQLCKSNSKQAQFSREREIAEISAGLKGIAKDLGIPVVVLAQLNRDVDKRATKGKPGMPRMSDLRESGAIEQDADVIGLLHRSDYGVEDKEERAACAGRAGLFLAKNRNGETGPVPLTWVAELMLFESGHPERDDEAPREAPPKSRYDA